MFPPRSPALSPMSAAGRAVARRPGPGPCRDAGPGLLLAGVCACFPSLALAEATLHGVSGAGLELLPIGQRSPLPWSLGTLWFAAMALLVPALVWLACAWVRAVHSDPDRVRRRGQRELRALLRRMRRGGAARGALVDPADLRRWQLAVARAWGVPVSAPTVDDLAGAVRHAGQDEARARGWRELWLQAETAAFSARAELPSGWFQRMCAMVEDIEMPKRTVRLPDRRAHWLPVAGMLLALTGLSGLPPQAKAQGATAPDMDAGAWRERLQDDWSDWAAHHNLSVALQLDDDLHTATGHAAAAFLLHPSAERRQRLGSLLAQAQTAGSPLDGAVFGPWYGSWPFWLSAARWQRLALAGGAVLALALSALVVSAYVRVALATRLVGVAAAVLGGLLFVVSAAAWQQFGELRTPTAGLLVRNVNLSPEPTDLVPEEETSPLPAGTVVQARDSFLGWRYVSSARGPEGWVRKAALVPFYGAGA